MKGKACARDAGSLKGEWISRVVTSPGVAKKSSERKSSHAARIASTSETNTPARWAGAANAGNVVLPIGDDKVQFRLTEAIKSLRRAYDERGLWRLQTKRS